MMDDGKSSYNRKRYAAVVSANYGMGSLAIDLIEYREQVCKIIRHSINIDLKAIAMSFHLPDCKCGRGSRKMKYRFDTGWTRA